MSSCVMTRNFLVLVPQLTFKSISESDIEIIIERMRMRVRKTKQNKAKRNGMEWNGME